jgi:importin-9
MVKDQHPQAVKEATASVLPIWLEAFKVLLDLDPRVDVRDGQAWDGLTVRREIYKVSHHHVSVLHTFSPKLAQTLETIHTSFPRALTPYLPFFLSASLNHLQLLYPTYIAYHISASATAPTSEEDAIDLPQLICPLMDLVGSISRNGKAKEWFLGLDGASGKLGELVTEIIRWAQMSEADVRCFRLLQISCLLMAFPSRKRRGQRMPTHLLHMRKMRHRLITLG